MIYVEKKYLILKAGKGDKSRYFYVLTGHHDWGNDSCDSMKYRDICPDCIENFVKNYIKKIDGTDYIEIETEYAHEEKYFDEEYDE